MSGLFDWNTFECQTWQMVRSAKVQNLLRPGGKLRYVYTEAE